MIPKAMTLKEEEALRRENLRLKQTIAALRKSLHEIVRDLEGRAKAAKVLLK